MMNLQDTEASVISRASLFKTSQHSRSRKKKIAQPCSPWANVSCLLSAQWISKNYGVFMQWCILLNRLLIWSTEANLSYQLWLPLKPVSSAYFHPDKLIVLQNSLSQLLVWYYCCKNMTAVTKFCHFNLRKALYSGVFCVLNDIAPFSLHKLF